MQLKDMPTTIVDLICDYLPHDYKLDPKHFFKETDEEKQNRLNRRNSSLPIKHNRVKLLGLWLRDHECRPTHIKFKTYADDQASTCGSFTTEHETNDFLEWASDISDDRIKQYADEPFLCEQQICCTGSKMYRRVSWMPFQGLYEVYTKNSSYCSECWSDGGSFSYDSD